MTLMTSPIPVVLFTYSRPDHLRRVLACLRENNVPLIYAFADGPKFPEVAARVNGVRAILHQVDWSEIYIVERDRNLGLGTSILTGVEEVFRKHDAIIVIEDDLVFVPGTYQYLCAALEHYKDEPGVMSVTGWTHPRLTPSNVKDQPYFDGRTGSLGWGSWARAWKGMDENAISLRRKCQKKGIDIYKYGADLPETAWREQKINVWAVRFAYLHILKGGLCLRPPWSMVQHAGWDSLGTNAIHAGMWADPPLNPCPPIPVHWGVPEENPECAVLSRRRYGEKPTISRRIVIRSKFIYRELLRTKFGTVFSLLVKVSKPFLKQLGFKDG
jgi:hypothetical protein